MTKKTEISYRNEVYRKLIHLNSLSIPIIYSFVTREFALSLLIPLTVFSIIIDFVSRKPNKFSIMFHKIFGKILRPHEYNDVFTLNGATWVLISASICILVFPKLLTVVGFSILIISDISSALYGRKYGKHPSFTDKTWEGTFAFWVTAILVVLIIGLLLSSPWTYYLFGIIAAIIGGFAEASSTMLKMDDNLTIPISIALVMWGGAWISANYFGVPYLNLLI